jgi:1-deoxy-D-xylulose-5-phosphate synthase
LLDISYFRGYPNIVLMAPRDEGEMRDMILTSIEFDGPAAIRYPRGNGVGADIEREPQLLEIGKGETLRTGTDVVVVAYGSMVNPAMDAAKMLEKDGVDATVVNARFVKPLDEELILSLLDDHRVIVTVEEAYLAGGFGSAVMELLESKGLQDAVKVVRMGVPDKIVTHGDPRLLLAKYGLDADGIHAKTLESVRALGERKSEPKRLRVVR